MMSFGLPKGARYDMNTGQWIMPGGDVLRSSATPNVRGASQQARQFELLMEDVVPLLKHGERGAVMADSLQGMLMEAGSKIDYGSNIDGKSCLTSFLFTDRNEYINIGIQLPSRIGRDDLTSFRNIGSKIGFPLEAVAAAVWHEHERVEPGAWTIWHDVQFDPLKATVNGEGLAFKLRLQNAVLIPCGATSLDQVLDFKKRHRGELDSLRHHLEELCVEVSKGGNDPAQIRIEVERLDRALAEYLNAIRKTNWEKIRASLDVSMDWSTAARAVFSASTATAPALFAGMSLTETAAILGSSVAAGIGLQSTFGNAKPVKSPFAYCAYISKELPAN